MFKKTIHPELGEIVRISLCSNFFRASVFAPKDSAGAKYTAIANFDFSGASEILSDSISSEMVFFDEARSEIALKGGALLSEAIAPIRVVQYDENGAAIERLDIFFNLDPASVEAQEIFDLGYLQLLQEARAEATDTSGLKEVELPDGQREVYRGVEALDNKIQMILDRINRRRNFADGRLPSFRVG